jgi:hypothetical protein
MQINIEPIDWIFPLAFKIFGKAIPAYRCGSKKINVCIFSTPGAIAVPWQGWRIKYSLTIAIVIRPLPDPEEPELKIEDCKLNIYGSRFAQSNKNSEPC